jgi:putative FmdB family regulatory protein
MPFYEYQCKACGAEVEVLQKITDAPLKKCPECGKSQLAKLVSAPVFRLKGGGWYETDFKTDKDNKRNLVESEKGEAKSQDKAEAKADSKAEAKPEAKAESKPESKGESRPAAKSKSRPVAKPVKKPAAKAKSKGRR